MITSTQLPQVQIHPWKAPLGLKIFTWSCFAIFFTIILLVPFSIIARNKIDWGALIVFLFLYALLACGYAAAVWYNGKLKKRLLALAQELKLTPFYSRGGLPGFIYWPGLAGEDASRKIVCRQVTRRRMRFAMVYVTRKGTSSFSPKNLCDALSVANPKIDFKSNSQEVTFFLPGSPVDPRTGEEIKKYLTLL